MSESVSCRTLRFLWHGPALPDAAPLVPVFGIVEFDGAKDTVVRGVTVDAERAQVAGLSRVGKILPGGTFLPEISGFSTPVEVESGEDSYSVLTSRTASLTKGLLRDLHIGFVGVGASVNLVKACARTGVGRFSLWDKDIVELPNVGRTAYDMRDVGLAKTAAARAHIWRINPHVMVSTFDGDFLLAPEDALLRQFSSCDIVVMGTDNQEVQLRGNRIGFIAKKKMLFPGFYERAGGGEIIVVIPPGPCYRCQARARFEGSDGAVRPPANLAAESGLIFDCDHLDSMVGKIAVALLLEKDVPMFAKLAGHVRKHSMILSKHDPDLVVEGADLFGEFFGRDGIAFTYETLWLDPSSWRDSGCAVCGASADRAGDSEAD
jgi:molybdopterin/thiamine biosynthesis adenylyltransferase